MNVSTGTSQGRAKEPIRLWVDLDWYIPVDDDGRCVGECAEGALGFVIKLHSHSSNTSFTALKIPRLMGDTHRENAYISQLMEQELSAVKHVFESRNPVPNNTLIPIIDTDSPLRGFIRTRLNNADTKDWNGAIILVRFEKGLKPSFCLVKKSENGELRYLPENVRPISIEVFEGIEQKSQWSKTVFIEVKNNNPASSAFLIDDAFVRDSVGETWYAGLPSIHYSWAPGTLQESISRGSRKVWSIQRHLGLVEQICRGLRALHARNMLHADVRPANIVYQAEPTEPESYYLSDYGSFAQTSPKVASLAPDANMSLIGPVMIGERASAFYAPERRLGREREASDTAVILDNDGQLTIMLGWRSDLVTEEGDPNIEKINDYVSKAEKAKDEFSDIILRAGDRVQIREYIFELVEDERRVQDKQVFICDGRFWQIYHGKIAVESIRRFAAVDWMPIPRTVELLKWSVATDLYSLGALALYSIFRHNPSKEANGSEVEDQFREMLTYLNSVPYFNAVWPEIDWLRYCMEQNLEDNTLNSSDFARSAFIRHDRKEPGEKDPRTLRGAAIEITKRLTQTAPGIHRLVEALDFDLAAFVFLMHFSLCCLHRRSHLLSDNLKKEHHPEWNQMQPFCKDRLEEPEDSNAADEALKRLEYLNNNINKGQLGNMRPEGNKDILPYDPRPDVSVRAERDNLLLERDDLDNKLKQTISEQGNLSGEVNNLKGQMQHTQDKLVHLQLEKDNLMQGADNLQAKLNVLIKKAQKDKVLLDKFKEIQKIAANPRRLAAFSDMQKIKNITQPDEINVSSTDALSSPTNENQDSGNNP